MEIDVQRRQGDFEVNAAFQGSESGITALYGPSGAGKTSVVNMVAGLMRPDAGRIAVNGLCLFDAAAGIDLPPERRRVGYVFQDGRLLPHMSVRANLIYGMRLTSVDRRFVTLDVVVDLLGIGHLLDRRPAKLSGGEKQRVAIGRALLTSPALLLMDEPLASLDAPRKAEVLPFIMRLSKEFAIPILYVTHAVDEILNLADRVVVMRAGRAEAVGEPADLLSRPGLQERAGGGNPGVEIVMVVGEPTDMAGLTGLPFGDHLLEVVLPRVPRGTAVRVHIDARNVAIALEPPVRTSFQNILAGRIAEILDPGGPWVDVRLDMGVPLWAQITRQSLLDLELRTGLSVFAMISSVAVSLG